MGLRKISCPEQTRCVSPALPWLLLCIWCFGEKKICKRFCISLLCYKIDFSNIKFVGSVKVSILLQNFTVPKTGEQAGREADQCQDDFYLFLLFCTEAVSQPSSRTLHWVCGEELEIKLSLLQLCQLLCCLSYHTIPPAFSSVPCTPVLSI